MTKTRASRNIFKMGIAGGFVAAALNIIVFEIAKASGISFTLPAPGQGMEPIDLHMIGIIISSIIPALGAILVAVLLKKYAKTPYRIFLVIAIIVLAASALPLSINIGMNTKIVLGSMHLISFGSIVLLLRPALKSN